MNSGNGDSTSDKYDITAASNIDCVLTALDFSYSRIQVSAMSKIEFPKRAATRMAT
ncbi:hypothetical protein B0A55_12802 [Friedmanniomyces simplex]|uniref:Uncharacterized protein n=1 Tax=Friedmanniomyces simplex TaxID=329884 RepID=A0A4U0WSC2_9PEZI|nr:hypothetical protein B0A55_12802 [Friedmanniomyces simplex]